MDVRNIRWLGLRWHQRVIVVYFLVAAVLLAFRGVSVPQQGIAWALALAVAAEAWWESRQSNSQVKVRAEFASLLLILAAYWEMALFADGYWQGWEARFQAWDVALLMPAKAFSLLVGPMGSAFAWLAAGWVQFCYALLYVLPPIYLAALHWTGAPNRTGIYLFTLFLGTLGADLILPHTPVRAPRIAFPEALAPGIVTLIGRWNMWVLDHVDIATSVFPSGHVAVAFSGAFGLLRAVPQNKGLWLGAFFVAASVWAGTVYCRYHYAADGAASFVISALAWRASGLRSVDALKS